MSLSGEIRAALEERIEPDFKERVESYFNEEINILGVRTPEVRKVSRRFYSRISELSKDEIFDRCEELLRGGIGEEITIALDWAWRQKRRYEPEDIELFERWLGEFVSNWGHLDDLCCHAIGYLFHEYPELAKRTDDWARSGNRWFRRAGAVSLIYPARRDVLVDRGFRVADLLLEDGDDLVRKGYGWLLKEIGKRHPGRVFEFLADRVGKMPRVAFRYALEKLPADMRERAMSL